LIHPSAVIDNSAKIGENVDIGPFSIIGADVVIGNGTTVASHVVINGPTTIGKDNRIYQFSSIGENPQDKKFEGENETTLHIGDSNTIREFCSINRGTVGGGGITRIGNNNWIMAYVHIAHDCIVGNSNIFSNNATLAGHVTIDEYVTLGGFTGVHQFCTLGKYCFSAIASVIVKDIPPFLIVSGNTAKPGGLNRVGLERQGINKDRLNTLRKAYKIVYREGLLLKDAIEKLERLAADSEDVALFLEFIKSSKRGIVR
jgi:UDP-N-acetylglucosamine acyltransferase